MSFDDYDQALTIATQCNLGLVASVFTTNIKKAFCFAERLRTGIVNVNDNSNYWESHIPFGGTSGPPKWDWSSGWQADNRANDGSENYLY